MLEHSAEKISEKIFEYAELKNKRTLEIGCGTGRITSRLSSQSELLIAIDPDEKAITKAVTEFPEIDFRIGTGESLNFQDNSFDIVIFTLSLHHQNSQKALSEAIRVLRDNGKILIIEPVADGEIERIFSFLLNEDEEKTSAQNSILYSGLNVLKSEIFFADWVFDNEADLLKSVFEHYNMPFNRNIAKRISDFLGTKLTSSPIICEDKMIIQSLHI